MKLYLILFAVLYSMLCADANKVFVDKEGANEYLSREKRYLFEEFAAGNAERECYEEECNYEEAHEVFDDQELGEELWASLTDQCASSPCDENGTSYCENAYNGFVCHCRSGYVGYYCGIDVDECEGEPCSHGNCTNTEGSFHCQCDPGYVGDYCDVDFDECSLGFCPEGATCEDLVNSFLCHCPSSGCDVTSYDDQQQVEL